MARLWAYEVTELCGHVDIGERGEARIAVLLSWSSFRVVLLGLGHAGRSKICAMADGNHQWLRAHVR